MASASTLLTPSPFYPPGVRRNSKKHKQCAYVYSFWAAGGHFRTYRCLLLTIISLQRAWYGNGSFLTGNRFRTISLEILVLQNTYSVPFRGSFPAGKCVFGCKTLFCGKVRIMMFWKSHPAPYISKNCVVSYHSYFCLMQILIKIIVAGVKDECILDVAS